MQSCASIDKSACVKEDEKSIASRASNKFPLLSPKLSPRTTTKLVTESLGRNGELAQERRRHYSFRGISVPALRLIGYVVCTSLPLLYTVPNLKQTPKPAAQQKKEILLTQLCLTIFYFEYLCKTAKSSGSIRLYSPFSLFPSLSPSLILQIFAHKKQQLLNTFSPPSGGSGGCI